MCGEEQYHISIRLTKCDNVDMITGDKKNITYT